MQAPDLEKPRPSAGHSVPTQLSSQEAQWLSWLHEMLPDISQVLLFRVTQNSTIELCANNPADVQATQSVLKAVNATVKRARAIYISDTSQSDKTILSLPFRASDKTSAYVLVLLSAGLTNVQQHTAHKLALWPRRSCMAGSMKCPQTLHKV